MPLYSPRARNWTFSVAGALGLVLAASSAGAQGYDQYGNQGAYYGPNEQVEIIAPRLHIERNRLNAPLGKGSMSVAVRYDDLDLRTAQGAHELRSRIRFTAGEVCGQLAAYYPYKLSSSPSCYRTAVENATLRANGAIRDARDSEWR